MAYITEQIQLLTSEYTQVTSGTENAFLQSIDYSFEVVASSTPPASSVKGIIIQKDVPFLSVTPPVILWAKARRDDFLLTVIRG